MAAGEAMGLKAVWYILPLFIGAGVALFLDPPKKSWAIPVLLVIFMGVGEYAGPILSSNVGMFAGQESFARMTAAALGWTVVKMVQRTIRKVDLSGMVPGATPRDTRTVADPLPDRSE